MSDETFSAILEKSRGWTYRPEGAALRFIGWGEPLMHQKICEFVARANRAGRITHINTNGSRLLVNRDLAKALVNSGLSSIKFSFQGADRQTYHEMRRIDFFEELFEAIQLMRDARGSAKLPFIAASTTTTTESPEMIEEFRARMEPLVDHLSVGKTIFEFIDMASVPPKRRALLEEAAKNETVTKKHPSPCPEVYDKLTIHWNGDVRVCCNDYSGRTNLGNIIKNNMRSIWRHPTMEAYRERLSHGEYSGPLCGNCYDYQSLTQGSKQDA